MMNWDITLKATVQKFPGISGWFYIPLPKKYTKILQERRHKWGMFPIDAHVGNTTWQTKLMMKKGGDFFVALKASIRNKEKICIHDHITLSIKYR